MVKVCIVGGGSLGHVIAGFIAARNVARVTVLTRRPADWDRAIVVTDPVGKVYRGELAVVTADASVVHDVDVVLLCLPGYAIAAALKYITPHLRPSTLLGSVVSSTGFFLEALPMIDSPLFGFQRVPFIARTSCYGHSAQLLGYKPSLNVAVEQCDDRETVASLLSTLLDVPVNLLDNYYEATFTNSNPLLHPARLYTLWNDYDATFTYDRCPGFYSDWTDDASVLYIGLDSELQRLLATLDVREGAIPTVLDYYESHDTHSLTAKLRSIAAFKGIPAPMKQLPDGHFIPDFTTRYFTEDFPCGLALVKRVAGEHGLQLPLVSSTLQWGMEMISRYGKGK